MSSVSQFEQLLASRLAKLQEELVSEFSRGLADLQDENDDLRRRIETLQEPPRAADDFSPSPERVARDPDEQEERALALRAPVDDRDEDGHSRGGRRDRDGYYAPRSRSRDERGSREDRDGGNRQTAEDRSSWGGKEDRSGSMRDHGGRDERSRDRDRDRDPAGRSSRVPVPPPPAPRRDTDRSRGDQGGGARRERSRSREPVQRKISDKGAGKGGGKGTPVCFLHLIGKCRNGAQCLERHPDGDECVSILDKMRNTSCKFGTDCKRRDCVFQHPGDRGQRVKC